VNIQEILTLREQHQKEIDSSLSSQYELLKEKHAQTNIELIGYKTKAHFWGAQFKRVKSRELELIEELEATKEALRKREQQLFGRSSEKNVNKRDLSPNSPPQKPINKRGQQKNSKGHGRREQAQLPVVEEVRSLNNDDSNCSDCGKSFCEMSDTEDSSVIEIVNVKAYKRIIKRKRYRHSCSCNKDKQTTTAPKAGKLYQKTTLGVSVWCHLLLQKYAYHIPLNRTLKSLASNGLELAPGTIVDGFKRLIPLLTPVYDLINERSLSAKHWHADETSWKVFEDVVGKKNHRWFMWIFHNDETVVYKICPSRSAAELTKHFGEEHDGGTLNVDRYAAYKTIAKKGLFILAFCWAHVRRDFLSHAKACPTNEDWALSWVDDIALLYHINNERIKHKPSSKIFKEQQFLLLKQTKKMQEKAENELNIKTLRQSAKKILISLQKHWEGLIIFIDEPSIPMDNNTAERGLRGPVIGRNGYYGSGSIWASILSAMLFSMFKTLEIGKINLHSWLLSYFNACANNSGKPPENFSDFLPWNMSEKTKLLLSKPPDGEN